MSMEIPPPPDPKALMAEFDLGAEKESFGQNFLRDQNMLRVIADAARDEHQTAWLLRLVPGSEL